MKNGRTHTSLGILNGLKGPRFEEAPGSETIDVLSSSGKTYSLTPEQVAAAASMGVSYMETNPEKSKPDPKPQDEKPKSDPEKVDLNRVSEVEKEIKALKQERENEKQRAIQQQRTKELTSKVDDVLKDSKLNPTMKRMVSNEILRGIVKEPSKPIKDIAKGILTDLEASGVDASYLEQKREDREATKSTKGGTSATSSEEKKKFTASDLRSGKTKTATVQFLRNRRNNT